MVLWGYGVIALWRYFERRELRRGSICIALGETRGKTCIHHATPEGLNQIGFQGVVHEKHDIQSSIDLKHGIPEAGDPNI